MRPRVATTVVLVALLGACGSGADTEPACGRAAECDDGDPCTEDRCRFERCQHVKAVVDDGDACTLDACTPAAGMTHVAVEVDDGDACTVDRCFAESGEIAHTFRSDVDDGNVCTADACDPVGGVSHQAIPVDDGNACTVDACDLDSGAISHLPIDIDDLDGCTVDSCDPATGDVHHEAVMVDDGDACTIDTCNRATGAVDHMTVDRDDGDGCTSDTCDPATGQIGHTPRVIDDGDACTIDSCLPTTGAIAHLSIDVTDGDPCTLDHCDPATGETAHDPSPALDDGESCTMDSCDPGTGEVAHVTITGSDDGDPCTTDGCSPVDGTVTHALVDVDDHDACTVDGCDAATGELTHLPLVAIDDGDACTVDMCDRASGTVSHVPVDVGDHDACTVDSCDAASGSIAHAAIAGLDDGDLCTVDGCDPTDGSLTHLSDPRIDDRIDCTVDTCNATTGAIAHLPFSARCADGQYCDRFAGCMVEHPLTDVVITEVAVLGTAAHGPFVEIHNTAAVDGTLSGMTLETNAAVPMPLRSALDPLDTAHVPVVIPAGSFAYGVPNPTDATAIPADAAFVYGEPGAASSLAADGDSVVVRDVNGLALAQVSFAWVASDPRGPVVPGQFPVVAGVSTQLDLGRIDVGSGDGSDWCLSFRQPDTAGAPNGSCSALVINEVLYDYDHPILGAADNKRVFVEIAGPGGANLDGVRVEGIDGDGVGGQAPNVTIRPLPDPHVASDVVAPLRMPLDGFLVIADGAATNGATDVPNADIVLGVGDPSDGTANGDGILLYDATGALIDAVAYGPATLGVGEGTPVPDVDPDEVAISIARDELARDTDDNLADFHYDPTPTPGSANLPVVPRIVSMSPDDGLASTLTPVTFLAVDVGDFAKLDGISWDDNDVDATFLWLTRPDGFSTTDGCDFLDITDGGRGVATIVCKAPAAGSTALRGDVTLRNPMTLGGGTASLDHGWTYTLDENESGEAAEADVCLLVTSEPMTLVSRAVSAAIFARVREAALTDSEGSDERILAEVGLAVVGADPTTDAGWSFVPAVFSAQAGDEDEYLGTLVAPIVKTTTIYSYTFRFSFDGGMSYTYCDRDGAGSAPGSDFDPALLGTIVVNP